MTEFTKGGWDRNIKPATKYPTVFAGRNTHVAYVATSGLPPEEVEANIRLIAAAPDLLEALQDILNMSNGLLAFIGSEDLQNHRLTNGEIPRALAAIKRARGK